MNRGGLGGILLLFAVLAVACVALVAVSDEAEATIVGEPLPSWGNTWYIFQDTVARDEVIRLDGDIRVVSPYTLSLDGCIVIFNGTYDGDNGINVDWGSLLYMNDTSTRRTQVRVNASSSDWDFSIYGEAYIKNSDMHNLYNGVRNYGYLWMEGSTLDSSRYGISSFSDFHCGNSTIKASVIPGTGYTEVFGIFANDCDASLHNLKMYVDGDMNFTYNSSSYYHDAVVFGIYAYNVDMG